MPEGVSHITVVAGEASGDVHAADFVRALRDLRPSIRVTGMGASAMRDAGVNLVVDSTDLSVMGFVEVLGQYANIRKALNLMKAHLAAAKPDLLVLVDYVEFNLRLARAAKEMGIKVLFYVSPQVWAWRPKRIRRIGESIDAIAVLFPFEEDLYRRHGIAVRYVGNPLVDQVSQTLPVSVLRKKLGIDATKPMLGLLPGSRRAEIRRHLPIMVKACTQLRAQFPQLQLVLAVAPGLDVERDIRPALPPELGIALINNQSHEVIAASDALIIASGTATLEAALLTIPMAIIYRVSPLTYAILKRFLLIRDFGLVNIVAGRRIVNEYMQHEAKPDAIAAEITRLLTDAVYAEQMRTELKMVQTKLGEKGASKRVALMALELLETGKIA